MCFPPSVTMQLHMAHSPDVTQPPITTSTYALEFQKAIEQSSHGRQILFIQVHM